MNAEERQIDCVISTKKDLEELVRQALVSGVLHLENCKIDVPFNLAELLLECDPLNSQSVIDPSFHNISISNMKCSFEINFVNTHFLGGFSTFYQDGLSLKFIDITFTKKVDFASAIFEKGAEFLRSTFQKEALFFRTTFKGYVGFDSTTFKKGAMFATTTFHDAFLLSPKELQGSINIQTPQFEGEKSKLEVNFKNCDENSKGNITFDDLKMDQDRIYITVRNLKEEIENVEIKFKTCNFYGKNISFKKVNNIDAVNFDDVDDISGFDFDLLKPTVLKRTIHMLWTFPFNRYQFQAIHKNTDEALKKVDMWASIYANLKAKADEKGERQLGNDYFFWQQYFQGKSPLKSTKHWVNSFYMNTSVYGLSYILPLVYFSLVLFFGGIFYNFLGDFTTVSITSVQKSFCSQIMVYVFEVKGYIVSISASLPFVFSDSKLVESLLPELPENAKRLKTGLFYFGYILQHLIQGYLLFQIGAAIRNKVKR
ncbi:MAG: hypothetical protein HEQ32_06620 [Vampirovibrio sp.]